MNDFSFLFDFLEPSPRSRRCSQSPGIRIVDGLESRVCWLTGGTVRHNQALNQGTAIQFPKQVFSVTTHTCEKATAWIFFYESSRLFVQVRIFFFFKKDCCTLKREGVYEAFHSNNLSNRSNIKLKRTKEKPFIWLLCVFIKGCRYSFFLDIARPCRTHLHPFTLFRCVSWGEIN